MINTFPYPLPPAQTPIVDPQTGALTSKDGRFLILALLNRTGGSSGAPSVGTGLEIEYGQPFNVSTDWTEFDTVPLGGIALLPELSVGAEVVIYNGGFQDIRIQPQPDMQIDLLGLGVGYLLASMKMQVFRCFTPIQIRSMQLG